ncbi:MAG TPA: GAF domain-containing protein [Vicinamibacteria bacterium]|nr:GAF domain-containing protein [Vicinamibacteria bacterium]
MSDDDRGHAGYVRKVLDGSQRYTQELLEKNHELRALVARLEVEKQRLQRQVHSFEESCGRVRQLEERLYAAERENASLRDVVTAHGRDQERLQVLLRQVDEENRRYSEEFAQLQAQANNLANLYVASFRLHGTLDRRQLIEATKEIVANLIGSEEMALFELDRARHELVLLDVTGVDPAPYRRLPLDRGVIGAAVRCGRPVVVDEAADRAQGEEELTAVIPLRQVDEVNGAVAIFRLLPQKARFGELDRELFDLLAAQAGMALHCTALHARLQAASGAVDPAVPAPA